ncbi:MAG: META domain-containing protein [Pseudomonadota bacterium]
MAHSIWPALAAALAIAACGGGEPAPRAEPAYLPESVRLARAQAAEQAEKLKLLTAGSTWTIESVSGTPLTRGIPATLAFPGGDAVSGNAGCNTFSGTFLLEEGQLSFGRLATTRKLCPEPVMDEERFLLETLGEVISAGVDEEETLFLSTLAGDIIRLQKRAG